MAVDRRSSAAFLMCGFDPRLMLREMLGKNDGLCGGKGGHMHLFSKEHLAASSGIVGAGGPVSVGFGLASNYLRPGSISVAFFGEGAMNQGMLMECLWYSGDVDDQRVWDGAYSCQRSVLSASVSVTGVWHTNPWHKYTVALPSCNGRSISRAGLLSVGG